MIVESQHSEVSSSFNDSKVATISANGFMFAAISSGLYKCAVEAIVRELSANAWDSHRLANKLDVPFDIYLPTYLSQDFKIQDYGVGMTEEEFDNHFFNYGNSTKRNTNEAIGVYGLGSKSPLAYTSNINITCIKEGKKFSALMYLNAEGIPSRNIISREDTSEPNGVTISFPVKDSDIFKFESAAIKYLKYYSQTPNIFPKIPADFVKHSFDTSSILIDSSETYSRPWGVYLVMGNVPYYVDLPVANKISEVCRVFRINIDIKVPIGSLQIPPSRDFIKNTPQNSELILQLLNTHKKEIQNIIITRLNSKYNIFTLRNRVTTAANYDANLKWNGVKLYKYVDGINIFGKRLLPFDTGMTIYYPAEPIDITEAKLKSIAKIRKTPSRIFITGKRRIQKIELLKKVLSKFHYKFVPIDIPESAKTEDKKIKKPSTIIPQKYIRNIWSKNDIPTDNIDMLSDEYIFIDRNSFPSYYPPSNFETIVSLLLFNSTKPVVFVDLPDIPKYKKIHLHTVDTHKYSMLLTSLKDMWYAHKYTQLHTERMIRQVLGEAPFSNVHPNLLLNYYLFHSNSVYYYPTKDQVLKLLNAVSNSVFKSSLKNEGIDKYLSVNIPTEKEAKDFISSFNLSNQEILECLKNYPQSKLKNSSKNSAKLSLIKHSLVKNGESAPARSVEFWMQQTKRLS